MFSYTNDVITLTDSMLGNSFVLADTLAFMNTYTNSGPVSIILNSGSEVPLHTSGSMELGSGELPIGLITAMVGSSGIIISEFSRDDLVGTVGNWSVPSNENMNTIPSKYFLIRHYITESLYDAVDGAYSLRFDGQGEVRGQDGVI